MRTTGSKAHTSRCTLPSPDSAAACIWQQHPASLQRSPYTSSSTTCTSIQAQIKQSGSGTLAAPAPKLQSAHFLDWKQEPQKLSLSGNKFKGLQARGRHCAADRAVHTRRTHLKVKRLFLLKLHDRRPGLRPDHSETLPGKLRTKGASEKVSRHAQTKMRKLFVEKEHVRCLSLLPRVWKRKRATDDRPEKNCKEYRVYHVYRARSKITPA